MHAVPDRRSTGARRACRLGRVERGLLRELGPRSPHEPRGRAVGPGGVDRRSDARRRAAHRRGSEAHDRRPRDDETARPGLLPDRPGRGGAGRRRPPVWVVTSRTVRDANLEAVGIIERHGGRVLADTCLEVTLLEHRFGTVATPSGKGAYYLPSLCKQKVILDDIERLLERYA